MPYLPIDIDGRRNCAKAAAVLHASPGDVSWALQEMWEHVWREWFAGRRESADVLSDLILMGCLGPLSENSKAPDVLVGFGFLERVPTGYRIRGAAKWLFGLEGKSRGGKAAAGNLIPGGPKRTKSAESQPSPMSQGAGECRDLSREGAETPAETQPVGRPSALTPSTQHPAPKESTPLGERM